jgi:hypothetical protein
MSSHDPDYQHVDLLKRVKGDSWTQRARLEPRLTNTKPFIQTRNTDVG